MRIILGISGASGAIYGVSILRALHQAGVETHLVMSGWAKRTMAQECPDITPESLSALAAQTYHPHDLSAAIASGSFRTAGMIIAPCSMKTMAALAAGLSGDLMTRAADVCLKERRTLVVCPRETPLNAIHLENMLKLNRAGAVIMPPVPAFYNRPASLDDIIHHFTGRVLDHFGVDHTLYREWTGMGPAEE